MGLGVVRGGAVAAPKPKPATGFLPKAIILPQGVKR